MNNLVLFFCLFALADANSTFESNYIDAHKKFRSKIVFEESLMLAAQKISNSFNYHTPAITTDNVNVFEGTDPFEAVKTWYSKIVDYDAKNFSKAKEFTQLVWSAYTKVGCAITNTKNAKKKFFVCTYSPSKPDPMTDEVFKQNTFIKELKCLDAHNKYRKQHHFVDLKLDVELLMAAKEIARKALFDENDAKWNYIYTHTIIGFYRRNVYQVVESWYKYYGIWYPKTKIGCVVGYKKKDHVYVAVYDKTYDENILKFNETFPNICLNAHNNYRKLHNAQSLLLSPALQISAQKRVDNLLNNQEIDFSKQYGMNEVKSTTIDDPKTIIGGWYDQINDYDFEAYHAKPNKTTDNFTQIIWAETTELGCAYAEKGNRFHIVAFYNPKGNIKEKIRNNVYENKCLKYHNHFCRNHDLTPDLQLKQELQIKAEQYVELLNDKLYISNTENGINIFEGRIEEPFTAVQKWYDEIKIFNFDVPKLEEENKNFVQLIWKAATAFGCSFNRGKKNKTIFIAVYDKKADDQQIQANIEKTLSIKCFDAHNDLRKCQLLLDKDIQKAAEDYAEKYVNCPIKNETLEFGQNVYFGDEKNVANIVKNIFWKENMAQIASENSTRMGCGVIKKGSKLFVAALYDIKIYKTKESEPTTNSELKTEKPQKEEEKGITDEEPKTIREGKQNIKARVAKSECVDIVPNYTLKIPLLLLAFKFLFALRI